MTTAKALLLFVGATSVLACKRTEKAEIPPSPGTTLPPASVPDASKGAKPASRAPLRSRRCSVDPSRIVTVSEGRGGITHAIAAAGATVIVTFGELRTGADDFPAGTKERFEMARAFDAASLAPRGPATVLGRQGAADAMTNGAAPFALSGGELGTATCAWAAFAGNLECSFVPVAPSAFTKVTRTEKVPGPGPERDRVAAGQLGKGAILALPQCQDLRIVRSEGGGMRSALAHGGDALTACDGGRIVDVPAIASAPDAAYVAYRFGKVIEGVLVSESGVVGGKAMPLSDKGSESGAPAIAWTGESATVAYATRTGTAPFALALTRWSAPGVMTRSAVRNTPTPLVAPALVATEDPKCVLASWTEGKGEGTRVRGGIICDDALLDGSFDISSAGIEAGDSELARSGDDIFVVWQELPKGKSVELRLARLTCG